ncbi:MAG: DNA repair protein RecN [Pseudomonadota bacterium]
MLTQLSISNYAIVDRLDVELTSGMTAITGETGAGKSIMLDALGLCLGDRADPKSVRAGTGKAEIIASFDLSLLPAARNWLEERDLLADEDCILRRTVTAEGRSRAYINGSPSTAQDCAELGALLIDIHSQHAHQSLLRKSVQRQLLDTFAELGELTQSVEQLASDWLRARRELELLSGSLEEHNARSQLLAYQVEELDELALGKDELAALEQEQKLLANAGDILASGHEALTLSEQHESGIARSLALLDAEQHPGKHAAEARSMLDSALIQLAEARLEIQAHVAGVEVDPERLAQVETRLESIYAVARKHRCLPEQLADQHRELRQELASLTGGSERIEALNSLMTELDEQYRELAGTLSKKRKRAATRLEKKVIALLDTLAMAQCQLSIALRPRESSDPHPQGREDVEFTISTNPGSPPQPLGKIASGGELSRISLAIQVVNASRATAPSMVFDEVDVGIGGAVAEVVGRLLRQLASHAQILCVTHLAQVASQAHQHLLVSKSGGNSSVSADLTALEDGDKVKEIARMLGGVKITRQSLAHAQEMLDSVEA